tara:strand:+ start:187 stop:429 length:243 start_codon:yes stop_codon:yes gene_type:complete
MKTNLIKPLALIASLLIPMSSDARDLNKEEAEQVLVEGEIIGTSENGTTFVIRHRYKIYYCWVGPVDKQAIISCYDNERN